MEGTDEGENAECSDIKAAVVEEPIKKFPENSLLNMTSYYVKTADI